MKYKILIISLLVFSCKNWNTKFAESDLSAFIVDFGKSTPKEIGLKEIAKSVRYIKLELKPECTIGSITELSATKDYFFLVNKEDHEIYQFTRTGEFVRKIGKAGRGPGEYPALIDLTFDESKGRIFVLTDFLRKILIYDYNGTYLNSINIPDRFAQSIDYIDSGIIAIQSGSTINTLVSTEIINEQGKSLVQFRSRIYKNISPNPDGKLYNLVYRYKNDFYVKEFKNDTVYKMTANGLLPYFVVNLGKFKPPLECAEPEWYRYYIIYRILETDNFIFILFAYNSNGCVARYNKSTKELLVNIPHNNEQTGIKNDFDNGPNFFLTLHPRTYKTSQQEWILPLSPVELLKTLNQNWKSGEPENLLTQIDRNDNPVIMVIEIF